MGQISFWTGFNHCFWTWVGLFDTAAWGRLASDTGRPHPPSSCHKTKSRAGCHYCDESVHLLLLKLLWHTQYIDLTATGEEQNKFWSSLMVCRKLKHLDVLLEIGFECLGGREDIRMNHSFSALGGCKHRSHSLFWVYGHLFTPTALRNCALPPQQTGPNLLCFAFERTHR